VFFRREKKFKPARTAAQSRPIADLDAMLVEPVGFRLLGRDHVINPISVEQFFLVTTKWAELDMLKAKKDVAISEVLDKYFEIISSVVDTISRDDLNQMSMQQIGGALQLVVETVTGKVFAEDQKKTLTRINAAQI
jgi:hypothetical protein